MLHLAPPGNCFAACEFARDVPPLRGEADEKALPLLEFVHHQGRHGSFELSERAAEKYATSRKKMKRLEVSNYTRPPNFQR